MANFSSNLTIVIWGASMRYATAVITPWWLLWAIVTLIMHDLIFYGFNLPCHIVASFMEALSALGFDGHVVGRRSGCNKTFMHRLLINVAGGGCSCDWLGIMWEGDLSFGLSSLRGGAVGRLSGHLSGSYGIMLPLCTSNVRHWSALSVTCSQSGGGVSERLCTDLHMSEGCGLCDRVIQSRTTSCVDRLAR